MPRHYRKLRGNSAYYPFAARTGMRPASGGRSAPCASPVRCCWGRLLLCFCARL